MSKAKKYYTALLFHGKPPKDLHVTHHYLGEQNSSGLAKITEVIESYMPELSIPAVIFNQVDYYGFKRDIRVLTQVPEQKFSLARNVELHYLAKALGQFRDSDRAFWNPHVTTSTLSYVHLDFKSYALVDNSGEVIKEWVINGV